jgi:hypothetical protein
MKNIHILPTDRPSRLGYLTKKGKEVFKDLRLFDRLMPNILDSENQNIYITSDEKIKKGDWYIADNKLYKASVNHMPELYTYPCKKISLTTDQYLIKEDVQAIDDEFLEWFVENPSCEEVNVEGHIYKGQYDTEWKIIIPKEEPKKKHIVMLVGDSVYKKETLEDAIIRLTLDEEDVSKRLAGVYYITEGAKWQQERMYSEKEVKDIIELTIEKFYFHRYALSIAEMRVHWFKQFKKK